MIPSIYNSQNCSILNIELMVWIMFDPPSFIRVCTSSYALPHFLQITLAPPPSPWTMQSLDQEPLLLSFLMTWVLGSFLKSLVMHFLLLLSTSMHVLPLLWSPLSAPKHYLQFVGGKACKSVSGGSVAVQSPGGSGVLGYCPESGRKDVRNAVEAASKVQPGWDRHTTAVL